MKKRNLQLILILITILIGYLSFNYYLNPSNKIEETSQKTDGEISEETKNNLIQNLIYNVQLNDNSKYNISAELSELTYENGVEVVFMQKVNAVFIDKNGTELKITSDFAVFNNETYNTDFSENVKINYLENVAYSNKLNLNFIDNIATITDNVVYEGPQGVLITDNVVINLISKSAEIFMNSPKEKVEVITKE